MLCAKWETILAFYCVDESRITLKKGLRQKLFINGNRWLTDASRNHNLVLGVIERDRSCRGKELRNQCRWDIEHRIDPVTISTVKVRISSSLIPNIVSVFRTHTGTHFITYRLRQDSVIAILLFTYLFPILCHTLEYFNFTTVASVMHYVEPLQSSGDTQNHSKAAWRHFFPHKIHVTRHETASVTPSLIHKLREQWSIKNSLLGKLYINVLKVFFPPFYGRDRRGN